MYFVRKHENGSYTFFGEKIDVRLLGEEVGISTKDIPHAAPEGANGYVVVQRERDVSTVQYLYSRSIADQMKNKSETKMKKSWIDEINEKLRA